MAIWARILWGWLGGSYVTPRLLLAVIGLIGGAASVGVGLYDQQWSLVEITGVAVIYNMTAISWHGILLAETARLAPAENVGGVTGGVLSFTSIAMMIYPAAYGGILAATGSYSIGFVACSGPSFAAFVIFLKQPIAGSWLDATVRQTTPRLPTGSSPPRSGHTCPGDWVRSGLGRPAISASQVKATIST